MRWMDDDILVHSVHSCSCCGMDAYVLVVVWIDADVGGGTARLDASAAGSKKQIFQSTPPPWCRLGKTGS